MLTWVIRPGYRQKTGLRPRPCMKNSDRPSNGFERGVEYENGKQSHR